MKLLGIDIVLSSLYSNSISQKIASTEGAVQAFTTRWCSMNYLRLFLFITLTSLLPPANSHAFTFDNWVSGISLTEANDTAISLGIVLRESRITSRSMDRYKSKKYADILMGYPAEVHLIFTSETEELCRVFIAWNKGGQEDEIHQAKLSTLFDNLKGIFFDKFSNETGTFNHKMYENTSLCNSGIRSGYVYKLNFNGQPDDSIQLSHSSTCNWVSIDYRDSSLYPSQHTEIRDSITKVSQDRKKF